MKPHTARSGRAWPLAGDLLRAGSAFSLLELVVVVVIIGIVAAIAIPRLAGAGVAAQEAALNRDLSMLRRAIELYAGEHGGVFPGGSADGNGNNAGTAAAAINQLTRYSNAQGEVSATRDAAHRYGPYLRSIPPAPAGPNAGRDGMAIDVVNPRPQVTAGVAGWVYNSLTGEIIVNTNVSNRAGTRTLDKY